MESILHVNVGLMLLSLYAYMIQGLPNLAI